MIIPTISMHLLQLYRVLRKQLEKSIICVNKSTSSDFNHFKAKFEFEPAHGGLVASFTSKEQISDKYFWHPVAETRTGLDTQNFLGYKASEYIRG